MLKNGFKNTKKFYTNFFTQILKLSQKFDFAL